MPNVLQAIRLDARERMNRPAARPPTEVMLAFDDEHCDELLVNPIRSILPITPASNLEQKAPHLSPEPDRKSLR